MAGLSGLSGMTGLGGIMAVGNAPPAIVVPSAQSATSNVAKAITGTSLSDADGNPQTVTLTVSHGTFSLASTTGLSFSVGDGTADATMTFSGSVANINTAIATLTYTSTTDYVGADSLAISTNDGAGGTDSDSIAITVTFTPESISTLAMWLDASYGVYSDAGTTPAVATDPIYRWVSRNSGSLYAEQATLARRPIYSQGANSKFCVDNTTTNSNMVIANAAGINFAADAQRTYLAHLRLDDNGSYPMICSRNGAGNELRFDQNNRKLTFAASGTSTVDSAASVDLSTWSLVAGEQNATNVLGFKGSTAAGSVAKGADGTINGNITLFQRDGAIGTFPFDGAFTHFCIFTEAVSTARLALLETYFATTDPT